MSLIEQQVTANRNAIQAILDNLKTILEHNPITNTISSLDSLLIQRQIDGKTLKLEYGLLAQQVSETVLGSFLTTETFLASDSQTEFGLSTTPTSVYVFKGRIFQIEGIDFTYDNGLVTFTNGVIQDTVITVLKSVNIKQVFSATDGQTNFSISGAPVAITAFKGRTFMIEGIDYNYSNGLLILSSGAILNETITILIN